MEYHYMHHSWPGAPKGTASQQWDLWTEEQRCRFLRDWCRLSNDLVARFAPMDWFKLSGHIRRAAKYFFDTTPILDADLGEMRYKPKAA